MKVLVFVEGKTEEKVMSKLLKAFDFEFRIIDAGGKERLNQKLSDTLAPLLGQPLRVLFLRDLDNNETIPGLVQSAEHALQAIFDGRGFRISPVRNTLNHFNNVFVWHSNKLDFRVALHIATYRWNESFVNATIDDYVLALALEPAIATAIAQSQNLSVNGEALIKKVTEELPALLQRNGISLTEAKNYVRLYAAIVKAHTSPPVLAEKVLNRSEVNKDRLKDHFKSIFAALESLK